MEGGVPNQETARGTPAGAPTGHVAGGQTSRSLMRPTEPAGGGLGCVGAGDLRRKPQVREDRVDDLGDRWSR